MSFKSLIALAVAAAGPGLAPFAGAATGDKPVGRTAQAADERFDQLDRNRDGFLSRDEANDASELHTRFSELDANNDGKLSRAEYRVVTAGETQTLPGAPSAARGATRP
jgi:hypothetical protein